DADMTATELDALRQLAATQRPLLLALNKADRYNSYERAELLARLAGHAQGLVRPENIVAVMAAPAAERVLEVDASGSERETLRERSIDVDALKARILDILESEGKTLAALNAARFAGRLADQVGERLTSLGRELADGNSRNYCMGKGVSVAL